MASLALGFPLLLCQGLPKGGQEVYQGPSMDHDDDLLTREVRSDSFTISWLRVRIQLLIRYSQRIAFIPIMIVILPLPPPMLIDVPSTAIYGLQWTAFWVLATVLVVPWLLCLYQLITNSVGRGLLVEHVFVADLAPKVIVVMPCYKETPTILLRTIDSLVDCDYPSSCVHVFISFDGDNSIDGRWRSRWNA